MNKIKIENVVLFLNYQFLPKPYKIIDTIKNDNYFYLDDFNFSLNKKTNYEILYKNIKNNIVKKLKGKNNKKIGVLFSGGIDSTIILHVLSEINKEYNLNLDIYTISAFYENDMTTKTKCKEISEFYNVKNIPILININNLKCLENIFSTKKTNPIGDTGLLAYGYIFENLKIKFECIFSGDGADCLFLGLESHYFDYINKFIPFKELNLTKKIKDETVYKYKLIKNKEMLAKKLSHFCFSEIFLEEDDLKLLNNELNIDMSFLNKPIKDILSNLKNTDFPQKNIALDLLFLANNRIEYIKTCESIYNVDIFSPFLEKNIINIALNFEKKLFFKHLFSKYILKKMMYKRISTKIINSPKIGTTPPFKLLYSKNFEFISQNILLCSHILPKKFVLNRISLLKRIIKQNKTSYIENMKIWNIFILGLWLKNFIKHSK